MFTRIIITLVILYFFTGCNGRLINDIDLDYIGDQLTMVGYISPTEIRIRAGRTRPADGSFYVAELFPPADMEIQLLDARDSLIHRLTLTDRRFFVTKNIQLKIGFAYRVRATATGFPTVESTLLQIPEPIADFAIQPIKDIDDLGIPGTVAGQLDFSFTDQSPIRNFYYINIGLKKDTSVYPALVWIINEQWQQQCFSIDVFNDDCFNQQNVTLQYGFQKVIYSLSERPNADTMLLRFGPNTPELYHYYQTNIIKNDELIQGINEPALTYTNLSNGYGVVFAQNWREYKVPLQ